MASVSLFEGSVAILCLIILHIFFIKKPYYGLPLKKSSCSPWNWPVLGMLPGVLVRLNYIYDYSTEVLENCNMTFYLKGPWFAEMDTLFTADPFNINHITTSNFSNYIKGTEMQEIFQVFGEGLLNSDLDLWKNLRKSSQLILTNQGFQRFTMRSTRSKIKEGLLPLFNHFAEEEKIVNLQDVFNRFTLDITFILITGSDPKSLSIEMPKNDFSQALADIGEAIFFRIITPKLFWRLQKWLRIGREKKMIEASATLDRVCADYISAKREEIRLKETDRDHESIEEDMLTSYIRLDTSKYENINPSDDKFLKDFMLSLSLAVKESNAAALTWFFWVLTENRSVLTKIRQEMTMNLPKSESGQERLTIDDNMEYLKYLDKLVYLHAALYESMRLYPPVPFERRSPIKQDVLPSGHKVKAEARILIFIYTLGRMKSVWGEDAMEFKPERWISETGGFKQEPAYKFMAFNAGPRNCIGRNIAMTTLKTLVVEILKNYDIKIVQGQRIEAVPGLILRIRQGLNVTLLKYHA